MSVLLPARASTLAVKTFGEAMELLDAGFQARCRDLLESEMQQEGGLAGAIEALRMFIDEVAGSASGPTEAALKRAEAIHDHAVQRQKMNEAAGHNGAYDANAAGLFAQASQSYSAMSPMPVLTPAAAAPLSAEAI